MVDESITVLHWFEFLDTFFIWPAITILSSALLCFPLQILYSWLFLNVKAVRHVLHRYVGTPDSPRVNNPALNSVFYIVQVIFSGLTVVLWWQQSYTRKTTKGERATTDVITVFFVIHWLYRYLQNAFGFEACFRLDTFIDAVTVVPEIIGNRRSGLWEYPSVEWEFHWMSMKFLRVLRLAQAYQRFEQEVNVSALPLRIFRTVLTTFALIISMAGTAFNVAMMGEIPGWADTYVITGMGDVSPIQMFYWIVTTISTVGYGDFSPSTGPSRVYVVGCIFGGCTFFATKISTFVDLLSDEAKGKGKYVRRFGATHHIVIAGSGAGKLSCFLSEFLSHVLQRQYSLGELPDIVLLSETGFDPDLREYIASSLAQEKRNHISLLAGSVMRIEDLRRVHTSAAFAVYIVPDVASSDLKTTDGENIMRAVYIKQCFPRLPVNLMLMRAQSYQRVHDMKIDGLTIFSVGAVKSAMFAQSCRIKGFMPLIASFISRPAKESKELVLSHLRDLGQAGDNILSYVESLDWMLHAFLVMGSKRSFQEAAAEVWEASKGGIILFAVLRNGRILLNCNGEVGARTVVVGLVRRSVAHPECLQSISGSWDFISRASQEEFDATQPPDEFFACRKLAKFDGETDAAKKHAVPTPFCINEQERGNLIVAIVPSQRNWCHVLPFIRALRRPELPVKHPILVISKGRPPHKLVDAFGNDKVHFASGDLQKLQVLREKELQRCRALVTFCEGSQSQGSCSSTIYADAQTITSVGTIEEILEEYPERSAFCIYEFSTTDGLRFIHDNMQDARSRSRRELQLPGSSDILHAEHEASFRHTLRAGIRKLLAPTSRILSFLASLLPLFFQRRNVVLESDPPHRKLIFQDLFASGRALTPELFGTLLGNCYHAPFTLSLVDALCMTEPLAREQESCLLQIACPQKWVGKNFGDLQTAWLRKSDAEFESCGALIILAVYRLEDCDTVNGCNITVPDWSFTLEGADMLTVLGGKEFGRHAISQQLLLGDAEVTL